MSEGAEEAPSPTGSPQTTAASDLPAEDATPSTFLRRPDTGEEASRVLRDAARRAPLPSLSGLAFEVMGLAWVFGLVAGLVVLAVLFDEAKLVTSAVGPLFDVPRTRQALSAFVCVAPALFVSTRIAAGLARIASEGRGQGKGANAWRAWRLGRSTQVSAAGVWLQVFGMMTSATIVLLGPVVLLSRIIGEDHLGPLGVVLSGLALTFALVYGAGVGALQELAMASLVRHERGVGSAILHAWRLMRARPSTSRRMAAVEFASRVAIVALALAVGRTAGWPWGLAQLVLLGALVGGFRCHAWSLTYPRIGGLDP